MDPKIVAFVKENDDVFEIIETQNEKKEKRVRCKVTSHEMKVENSLDPLVNHLKTKKFLKAKKWYSYDFSKYDPFIVPHRRLKKSLYCNVTETVLNRIPEQVEKHVNGKKYQRLKAKIEEIMNKDKAKKDIKSGANDFDANTFEFANSELVNSDEDQEHIGSGNEEDLSDNLSDDLNEIDHQEVVSDKNSEPIDKKKAKEIKSPRQVNVDNISDSQRSKKKRKVSKLD